MIVGVVNAGGVLPPQWIDTIVAAIEAGLDVATGLHERLSVGAGDRQSRRAPWQKAVRRAIQRHAVRDREGAKRTGLRLLSVGTDCSVGKKYTSLAIERGDDAPGLEMPSFRATGQTGILISGRGVAHRCVVADFISGAAEWLSPANEPDHWDVVEGQGSLFHPSFAGVTLGLLHGSQPDAFVVCHEPTRSRMRGVKHSLPSIGDVIERTIVEGRLTKPEHSLRRHRHQH